MTPRATYRLQFHDAFTFANAEAIVPYLDRLGISHVYSSPITVAAAGSTHGYDVVDPTRISPALGGEEGFRSLVAALRARGMGVILDIVPNHMGVAGDENGWWNDVLEHGKASVYARFFDIDWSERIVLPVLGAPLAEAITAGAITVEQRDGATVICAYGEHRFPIRPEDRDSAAIADLAALLDRQHYRLAYWRVANDELNWRRFFTVNELAGLRIEDPAVFERTHEFYFRLWDERLIDGVRVDHVDGLTDPAGYCRALRDRLGPDAYIIVEKILGAGEPLPGDWGLDGTSGYDFMAEVAALLHAPEGEQPLGELWAEVSGRPAAFEPEELQARQDMLSWAFGGQLNRCVDAFVALARSAPEADGVTAGMLRRAVERLLWVFPVYRTYGTGDAAPAGDARTRRIVRERVERFIPPGEANIVDLILSWLAGEGPGDPALAAEAVRRFQQLSAPIAAKAVEDTAFYRYGRLLSRNDVGFDASVFAWSSDQFHAACQGRATRFPHALLATATHDHKRGEDVRARLAVVSDRPEAWLAAVKRWTSLAAPFADGIDPADQYMVFQTLFGGWPDGLAPDNRDGLASFAERINQFEQKALREGKLRSSWEAPDEAYEDRCRAMVDALLDPARSTSFLEDLRGFVERTAAAASANSLVQTGLRYTVPGVPDLYQGTELPDLSLVDPDNRRPVDFAERERLLGEAPPEKMALIAELLDMRRREPALFIHGDYQPIPVTGARADHVLAFLRGGSGERLLVVAALRCAEPLDGASGPIVPPEWWGDTALAADLPETQVASLLADGPFRAVMLP